MAGAQNVARFALAVQFSRASPAFVAAVPQGVGLGLDLSGSSPGSQLVVEGWRGQREAVAPG